MQRGAIVKLTYVLSNGQRKELLVRGRPVLIALPAPPIDVEDPIDWARSMLPADLRGDVVSAEECEVRATPLRGRTHPPTTLTHLLGDIVDVERTIWTACHQVVLVRLEHGKPRGPATSPMWPANVHVDGVPLLPVQPRE